MKYLKRLNEVLELSNSCTRIKLIMYMSYAKDVLHFASLHSNMDKQLSRLLSPGKKNISP